MYWRVVARNPAGRKGETKGKRKFFPSGEKFHRQIAGRGHKTQSGLQLANCSRTTVRPTGARVTCKLGNYSYLKNSSPHRRVDDIYYWHLVLDCIQNYTPAWGVILLARAFRVPSPLAAHRRGLCQWAKSGFWVLTSFKNRCILTSSYFKRLETIGGCNV